MVIPSRTLDYDARVGQMHNGELTPTEKPGFSRTKTGCRDCLSVIGIIPLKAGWLVDMHLTYGASVCPENAVTYSAGNEGHNICGDLPETTASRVMPRNMSEKAFFTGLLRHVRYSALTIAPRVFQRFKTAEKRQNHDHSLAVDILSYAKIEPLFTPYYSHSSHLHTLI